MRKFACGFLAALLLCATALAHPPITVSVNGQQLSFDQPPILQDDRTLVPMRGIFQALGASVSWDEPSQTVTATSGSDVILFRVGEAGLYKNGNLVYTMPVPAQIVNDRLLVPLRAVAESMGASVGWDEASYAVTIVSGGAMPIEPTVPTEPTAPDEAVQDAPAIGGFFAEVKAADGTVVLTAKLDCDTLSGSAGAESINLALATETFALGQSFVTSYKDAALAAYAAQGEGFLPYYYISNYELTRAADGYASFFASATIYHGGNEERDYRAATYDLSSGKAQSLRDLLSDSTEDLQRLYTAGFGAMIAEQPKGFYADADKRLAEHLDEVGFYLTAEGIVFFLPPGVIAPADAGVVAFTVEYEV